MLLEKERKASRWRFLPFSSLFHVFSFGTSIGGEENEHLRRLFLRSCSLLCFRVTYEQRRRLRSDVDLALRPFSSFLHLVSSSCLFLSLSFPSLLLLLLVPRLLCLFSSLSLRSLRSLNPGRFQLLEEIRVGRHTSRAKI